MVHKLLGSRSCAAKRRRAASRFGSIVGRTSYAKPVAQAPIQKALHRYLMASGLTGEPTAPVIGSAGATNRNS